MNKNHENYTQNDTLHLNKSAIFFLPAVYIILHTLEELPGFAIWVETHFGSHPTSMFAAQHIVIWLLIFLFSYMAYRKERHGVWVVLATAAQIQFAFNALFHLGTFLIFQTYSPGMVTAGAIGLPLTIWFILRIRREGRISGKELGCATLIGAVIAILAISVLFIR